MLESVRTEHELGFLMGNREAAFWSGRMRQGAQDAAEVLGEKSGKQASSKHPDSEKSRVEGANPGKLELVTGKCCRDRPFNLS